MRNSPTFSFSAPDKTSQLLILDLLALALAGMGNVLMAARLNQQPIALALVGVAFVIRLAQTRAQFLKIPLHLPWLLFVVSAWLGVTVSFDPSLSLRKFDLIVGGIALYYVIAMTRTQVAQKVVAWGLVAVGAGVAVFYLTQTDFDAHPTKIALLNEIGSALHRLTPQLAFHNPHPNLMAGILLLALPFALGLVYDATRHKHQFSLALGGALTVLIGFALVMTTSRGALLALALVAGAAVYAYATLRAARQFRLAPSTALAIAFNVMLVVVLVVFVVGGARVVGALGSILGSVNSVPRPELYRQVFGLTQDYAFTGAGLDTFSPNYSTYAVLIDVPLLAHSHDLYLQVWFEQGLIGLVAFLWMIAAYYWWAGRRRGRMNWLAAASLAAVTLMLLHGLVDVLFYFSRVISLMFIPLGLTVSALEPLQPLDARQKISARARLALAGAGCVLLLLVGGVLVARRAQVMAQWLANMGALKQAQLELPFIRFPHPTYAEWRRKEDLSSAENLFTDALARDPNNRTANARLGMIALDRFEFDAAVEHLENAYRVDTTNRAVIKALGYAYVWKGKLDDAEKLLRQIPEAALELGYTIDDWHARGRNDLAGNAQRMARRLKP